ncbi:MAG: adenylate/guanylate cyclase domain-containing protein [Alphaproteobacteria bacterium]|nr:adenylate/guanylate cyclase domain-containing protein [Alphaproteobacteria bacterium]
MNAEENSLAVLFADISGSTKLYESQGDRVARDLTSQAINIMTACVEKVGGRVIKTIGDEIMASFPAAAAAYDASIAMQAAVCEPFSIRIGFHYGPVLEENGDVYGDTVNVAARVTDIATAGETILTENVLPSLSPAARDTARFLDSAELKGKALPVRIYKVVLEAEDATFVEIQDHGRNVVERRLDVTYRGQQRFVIVGGEALTLGRGTDCVLAVNELCVSRAHAKIYDAYGKFLVTDYSTNGTYVVGENGESVFVKRETVQLGSSGAIYLGMVPAPGYEGVILFSLAD